MPTCFALHPSQFDSQPLSQGPDSQQECSFGGGAPLAVGLAAARGGSQRSQRSLPSASPTNDELHNISERQEVDEEDPEAAEDSQEALLEPGEVIDKLPKMLRMRGKTLSNDLLRVMEGWLRELCAGDKDRQAQETSVATVEEFIRHSGVRFVDDLHLLDARARQWWTEGEGLDPKKLTVLKLLAAAKAKVSAKDADASKADTTNADETRTSGAPQRLATPVGSPSRTQQELIAETPQPSLDADQSAGAPGKREESPMKSPNVSPQRDARSEQPPVTAADAAAAAANNEGAKDLVKEGLPKDAMGTGASASSGNKRLREDEAGGEGRCVAPQDQDCMLDAQVESHRRGAEKSYEVYHELLAKRSRLAREVDGAKQLEKTRREIAKKLDKDKEACAAREQELSEAAAALEEAQKRVSAAQNAKRKQAASKLALEAEMKEVTHEQKESNQRLKVLTEEFQVLLAKNGSA